MNSVHFSGQSLDKSIFEFYVSTPAKAKLREGVGPGRRPVAGGALPSLRTPHSTTQGMATRGGGCRSRFGEPRRTSPEMAGAS